MKNLDIKMLFEKHPILAILRNIPLEKTVDYVRTIVEGGVNCFEVALNSCDAYKQIAVLKDVFGDEIIVGAGTAITVEKAEKAVHAGAEYLLTPSVDVEILGFCRENNIPFLPGVLTPSDVALCLKYGYNVMKMFPANCMPENYINSLKGPFNGTEYVAIGGVNEENITEFFKKGYLAVGLSSNIMPKEIVESEDWESGRIYISKLVEKVRKGRGQR